MFMSCLARKPPRAPQLEETPETPPSSRGVGLLHDVISYPLGSGLLLSVHFMEAGGHLQSDGDVCSQVTGLIWM